MWPRGDPTVAKLVRTWSGLVVDLFEGVAQVVWQRVGGGDGGLVGLDLDRPVSARGSGEPLD
jgi:hypothetical protein